MGTPSMPSSEVEVLYYARTVQGERRACCRGLDSEQCGTARSIHDTLKFVEPSHNSLQGDLLESTQNFRRVVSSNAGTRY